MSSKLKWSEEEEAMLRQLVNAESKKKWVEVADRINLLFPSKQRTSKQCRQKYINHVQYGQGGDSGKWSSEEQHTLFARYLERGSQWKHISTMLPGRSENAVKNKFYGKVRKLVRKLNSICRERINRSNKPLRDQSIMRIIDIHEGFENLPEHLVRQSHVLKNELIGLAERDMADFDSWDLIEQDRVVNLIRTIHKFNINSRYYCSTKKKATPHKKPSKQQPINEIIQEQEVEDQREEMIEIDDEKNVDSVDQKNDKIVEHQTYKLIPFVPIIVAGQYCEENLE